MAVTARDSAHSPAACAGPAVEGGACSAASDSPPGAETEHKSQKGVDLPLVVAVDYAEGSRPSHSATNKEAGHDET